MNYKFTAILIILLCLLAVFVRPPQPLQVDPKEVPGRRLDELQLLNCFSYYPAVTSYDILDGQSGKYIGKDK